MAVNQKTAQLINALIDATSEGRLEWSKLPSEETYRVALDQDAIRIEKVENCYAISIFNNDGDMVEMEAALEGELEYSSLEKLYLLARRSSLKVNDLIDRLINKIGTHRV
jgi:hypothetical protein